MVSAVEEAGVEEVKITGRCSITHSPHTISYLHMFNMVVTSEVEEGAHMLNTSHTLVECPSKSFIRTTQPRSSATE